jgi:hypothetical protein
MNVKDWLIKTRDESGLSLNDINLICDRDAVAKMALEAVNKGTDKQLTKREALAAMAMQGLLSNSTWVQSLAAHAPSDKAAEANSELAIQHADALLALLTKGAE